MDLGVELALWARSEGGAGFLADLARGIDMLLGGGLRRSTRLGRDELVFVVPVVWRTRLIP